MFSVIFPGQGSQIVGMTSEFYSKYDLIKKLYKEADEVLNYPISKLILNGPKEELDLTENTQPAIFLVGYSIFQILKEEFNIVDTAKYIKEGEVFAYDIMVDEDELKKVTKRLEEFDC